MLGMWSVSTPSTLRSAPRGLYAWVCLLNEKCKRTLHFKYIKQKAKVFYEEETEKASKEEIKCPAHASYELPDIESFNLGIGECHTFLCICYVYNYHLLVCTPFDGIEQKRVIYIFFISETPQLTAIARLQSPPVIQSLQLSECESFIYVLCHRIYHIM